MQKSKNIERSPVLLERYYYYGEGTNIYYVAGEWKDLSYDQESNFLSKKGALKKKKKHDKWKASSYRSLGTGKLTNSKLDKRLGNKSRRIQELLFLKQIKKAGEVLLDSVAFTLIEDNAAERYHWA